MKLAQYRWNLRYIVRANMPTYTLFFNQFTSQYYAIYPYFLGLALTTRREWHGGRPREPSIQSRYGRPDQTLLFSDLALLQLSHSLNIVCANMHTFSESIHLSIRVLVFPSVLFSFLLVFCKKKQKVFVEKPSVLV